MAGFRSREAELKAMGVELVFIGSGNPMMATDFREELKLDTPVWVDTRRESYRFLGFRRGASFLRPAILGNAVRAFRAGFRQKRTMGDPWQQGGVLVVRKGGALVYSHASATAGDHPPVDEVVAAAREALAGARAA